MKNVEDRSIYLITASLVVLVSILGLGNPKSRANHIDEKDMVSLKANYDAVTVIKEESNVEDSTSNAKENDFSIRAVSILNGDLLKDFLNEHNVVFDKIDILDINSKNEKVAVANDVLLGEIIEEKISEIKSGEELIEAEVEEGAENIIVEEAPNDNVITLIDGIPSNYVSYIDCEATAYCLCQKCTGKTPGSKGYGRTASGYVITPGIGEKICAVSRSQIPLGTKIYVQGLNGAQDYGFALAADTGGAIKNNRIDLYFDSHATCLKWGRKKVRVYLLPEEAIIEN